MHVVDNLAAFQPAVHAQAVAALGQALVLSDLASGQETAAEHLGVARLHRHDRADVALGDDQQMDRRLRVDVLEREDRVVLVLDVGLARARDDAAENAVTHAVCPDAPAIMTRLRSPREKERRWEPVPSASGRSGRTAITSSSARPGITRPARGGAPLGPRRSPPPHRSTLSPVEPDRPLDVLPLRLPAAAAA